ncbi:hypothetical protein NHX12_014662 [Muraenolepis orangiensis]|uniref:MADF domain-containing protein n=1 Tax=Muraenolepis orangiensis TaxID=630683 RepID=A0A9Q0D989_9TELE|nr:hypothetical protein NHX12_014662 [Muraenolepis orangiensis]
MTSTVEQLKIWYTSMRTMMGRLKNRAKKSRSGGDALTDMNRTEKWVWDKFSFLIPHIETVDARNVASFAAAVASASGTELTPSTNQKSVVATTSRVATPTLAAASPPASQTASQPGSVGSRWGSEDGNNLVDFMSRSTAACGSYYFGKYVEESLSKLPGQIRRDAEANIMQELHRAQRAAENSQTQPPPSQHQQAPIQLQQQFQQPMWQPQPSQWPPHPMGPQPSIWASQDRSYVQLQFPMLPMTIPQTNKPQPGSSFVSLLGPITPDSVVPAVSTSPRSSTPLIHLLRMMTQTCTRHRKTPWTTSRDPLW